MAGPKQPKAGPSTARLKVVVRRLPADLPESVFNKTISPWAPRDVPEGGEKVLSWSIFEPGKLRNSGRDDKLDVHSRAYLAFLREDDLLAFHRAYNGWAFRDKQGNVSHAVVEFAPYQRIPSEVVKADPRQRTIEQDPDYEAFLASLSQPDAPDPPSEEMSAADKKRPQSTPLLDHLRAQKALQRGKGPTRAGKKEKGKATAADTVVLYSTSGAGAAPAGSGPGGKLTKKEAKALARLEKGKAPKPPKEKKPKKEKLSKAAKMALAASKGLASQAPPSANATNFPSLPGAGPLPPQIASQYEQIARQQAVLEAQQAVIQRQLRAQEQQRRAEVQQRARIAQQNQAQGQHSTSAQQPKIALLQNPNRAATNSPQPAQPAQGGPHFVGPSRASPAPLPPSAGNDPAPNGTPTPTGPKKSRRGGGSAKKAAAAATAGGEGSAQLPRSVNSSRTGTPAPPGEGNSPSGAGGVPAKRGRGRGRGGGEGGRGGGRGGRGRGGGGGAGGTEGAQAPPPLAA